MVFLEIPNNSDMFDIIRGKRPAVYFKNQKKSLHIIFKECYVIHRVELVVFNLCIKFEVSVFRQY